MRMKTVMIFGTFDGVHKGHQYLFRQARSIGERMDIEERTNKNVAVPRGRVRLYVVVARDSTVLAVKKRKPKYDECVRYAFLRGESEIDLVTLGNRNDKYAVVRKYKPDIICLGYDQQRFVEGLQKIFSGEIVRLFAFEPEVYKSSKMPKEKDAIARAKSILRNVLLTKRGSLSADKRKQSSEIITESILSLPEVRIAKTILLYRPMGSEVDIRALFLSFDQMGKKILVPSAKKRGELTCALVTPKTMYSKCSLGYPVPQSVVPYVGKIDMALVPCIGWDRHGNRLGRGGGWYDRFLAKNKKVIPIGVAFAEQEMECLPTETYDKKMAILCTTSQKNLPIVRRCAIFLEK
jgi:5-formyltetrahydrofolate cyclo-ligase